MGEERCPLCADHPRLVHDEGRAVCHTCGFLMERTEYEAVFDAQYGTGTRQLAPTGAGGALASSQFRMRAWARTQYASRPPDADTPTHVRQVLGRLAARIPAVGAAATPALQMQVQRIVHDVRARARQAKAASRAIQIDRANGEKENGLVSRVSAAASAASVAESHLSPQAVHALVSAKLSWGAQGHGNALVAAAAFALLYEGQTWVPLDPLAVVAETTAFNIQIKYMLLTHLYPNFSRTAALDPRTEIPGLIVRLTAVQSALRQPQPKRQRRACKSSSASALKALLQVDLKAVEELAMRISRLAGHDLALTRGMESRALRRDPLTAALSCLSLAIESCHGATLKRDSLADLMNIIVTAPSADAIDALLLSGPTDRPITSTLLRKYELLLNSLRHAAEGLPWLASSHARSSKPLSQVKGRDSFWDKVGRAAPESESKRLTRFDLIKHAQTIVSVCLAENQAGTNDNSPPTPTPAMNQAEVAPRSSLQPSIAALRGIQSWAELEALPPDELDRVLFRSGEVEGYFRSADEQEAYREALGEVEEPLDEELIGFVDDFPFPLWSTDVGLPAEDRNEPN